MLSDKNLKKLEKILGPETTYSIDSASPEELQSLIIRAETAIKQAKEELEANPTYQELKASLKAISEGLREVRKRQRAIIDYSLNSLDERGRSHE